MPEESVVYLLDASSGLERGLLDAWIAGHTPSDAIPGRIRRASLPASRRRQVSGRQDLRLRQYVDDEDDLDPVFIPLRVVWMAPEHEGRRVVRLRDLLLWGDPRDPNWIRQRLLLARHPERARIVVGESARLSELRERYDRRIPPGSIVDEGLGSFVAVQAHLALERAERDLRGNRYKVPRFVHEDLLFRRFFQAGLRHLAETTKWPAERIPRKAMRYLREVAATHSATVIDLVNSFTKFLIGRSYGGKVHYDAARLDEVYEQAGTNPMVFLPTHKVYIDTLILQHALYENDYPPNHTAGGINMSFWPVGPVMRRSGVFFIRRTFGDNDVYKFVVRSYIRYLVEKGFPLEWYIEGGRSRTGKLREPSFGLLAYVVDAWRQGAADDVVLVPVSIAYDQIYEVGDYAAEALGGSKRGEGIGRLIEYVRGLRRPHGSIHMRFGEPIAVAERLDRAGGGRYDVEKLAFEVAVRINEVTPITPISLVTLAMLGQADHAATTPELAEALRPYVSFVEERALPTTEPLRLDAIDRVRAALAQLRYHGVVTRVEGPHEAVYAIGPGQHHAAAYYRNTIIHFFVIPAIAEVALQAAAGSPRPLDTFWETAARLRDVLKFDFFFPERPEFRAELDDELARTAGDWQERVAAGEATQVLAARPLLSAHWVLEPFLESYSIVADALRLHGGDYEAKAVSKEAVALGRQYLAQGRLSRPEAVSTETFKAALALAENRKLLAPEASDGQKLLADEVERLLELVRDVERIAYR